MSSAPDIYTSYFGLTERPFSLVPDPSFLYWSALHKRAYAMLEYGLLTRAPITLITGEVGAGKTTLLHHLLQVVGEDVRIGLVANAHGDRGELLRWVLLALAQPVTAQDTYVDLFGRFQTYLIGEYAAGRRVILIFDEAQNLSRESLEELRMFTNINANKDELLQLVLVGQPELRDLIRRPDLTQFAQRISAAFHLGSMEAAMVRGYIRHRLTLAGAPSYIFSAPACNLIHAHTGGVPRLVNQLCDLAMVYAYGKGAKRVGRTTVQQVLDDGVFFAARGTPGQPPISQPAPSQSAPPQPAVPRPAVSRSAIAPTPISQISASQTSVSPTLVSPTLVSQTPLFLNNRSWKAD
jgi:type II secretory pathway predicted ATPase ExeA